MSVLMIDVGGTNVKIMNGADVETRKFRSGKKLTAQEMVREVRERTTDWEYEKISIGFPGLVREGQPVREPLNLGEGWVDFDYAQAFDKPVRFINDAAMQALGNYHSGRMLFLGLGTSTGTTLIADDAVIPLEIGLVKLTSKHRFVDRLSKEALKLGGRKRWLKAVHDATALLRDVFYPDEIVLGGGNARKIDPLPPKCRQVDNNSAYIGAVRLWEDADLFASACTTSWRIHYNNK